MKIVGIIVLIMMLCITGAVAFTYSGLFNVAATTHEPVVVRWMLENTRKNSIQHEAKNIIVPKLSGENRLVSGGKAFEEMCSGCHGAPGKKPFLGATDMNPPPPDLEGISRQRTAKELFWVVKNGIRMTGMPAWGPTHTDVQIWDLVAFMKRLPELSPSIYRSLIDTENEEHGHEHESGVPITSNIFIENNSNHSH